MSDLAHRSVGVRVTAIIPALDEEQTIGPAVAGLLRSFVDEVIVVDGRSSDQTASSAAAVGAVVVTELQRGYGRACLAGARAAAGADVLVFMDGDGSDVPEQADLLVRAIVERRADLVIGSRLRGSCERGSMTVLQRAGNRVVAAMLNRRFGLELTDIGPFRAIRAEVLDRLDMREMSYGWPTEMIRNTARAGGRVVEVPVDYRRRRGGASKVSRNLRASLTAGWTMLRVAVR